MFSKILYILIKVETLRTKTFSKKKDNIDLKRKRTNFVYIKKVHVGLIRQYREVDEEVIITMFK